MAGNIPVVAVVQPTAGKGSIQVVSATAGNAAALPQEGQAPAFKDLLSEGIAGLKLAGLGRIAAQDGAAAGKDKALPDEVGQALDPALDPTAMAGGVMLQTLPMLQQAAQPAQAGGTTANIADGKSIMALTASSVAPANANAADAKTSAVGVLPLAATQTSQLEAVGEQAAKLAALQANLPDSATAQASQFATSLTAAVNANSGGAQNSVQMSNLPVAQIAVPVQSPDWNAALGQRVIWMAGQQHQVAQLQLNPPNLGPLEIQLNIHKGEASAVFLSAHAPVRDAIENAIPKLREMLADSGISLGNVNVSSQDAQRDQSAFTGGRFPSGAGRVDAADSIDTAGSSAAVARAKMWNNGMVDTFV